MDNNIKNTTTSTSPLRRAYIARLVGRILVLCLSIVILFIAPSQYDILIGFNFFKEFSLFHILWVLWLIDMVCQLIPIRDKIPLGSQKLFQQRFKPIKNKINYESLKNYIVTTTTAAYKVMILWVLLISLIGILYYMQILNRNLLLICSVIFYVCDLICVLIWCPFRLILKNKCCTTCRIFNWDHMMMFSPLIFVGGFFSISLVVLSLIIWLIWELSVLIYPERFWEFSNEALKCSNCTDKLCTQYCQKLRRHK